MLTVAVNNKILIDPLESQIDKEVGLQVMYTPYYYSKVYVDYTGKKYMAIASSQEELEKQWRLLEIT